MKAAETVVPLFVFDPALRELSANRHRFLVESVAELRLALRQRGADLVVRQGDPVAETMVVAREAGASGIALAEDVSAYARRRERRLAAACEENRLSLRSFPGVTVVAPGQLRPGGGGPSYQVFTPYWRVWRSQPWRTGSPTPRRVAMPDGVAAGRLPALPAAESSAVVAGGEDAARKRMKAWLRDLPEYEANHDLMAVDGTSRLSPYLRFGCLSPLELAQAAIKAGDEAFLRQLCWRDFYYQVAAAFPALRSQPIRDVKERWRYDDEHLHAWQAGRTGVPIVDAGMRQLATEGWMHNRARLLTAAYLTKHLDLDWRDGADWFFRLLLDGDVPNNYGNWQWVAGTGNDTKPYRRFNPIRQAHRFDPEGDYVRRYVPELSGVEGRAVHEPWKLAADARRGYPEPLAGPRMEVWLPG